MKRSCSNQQPIIAIAIVGARDRRDIAAGGVKRYSLATVARLLGWVKPSGQAATAARIAFDAYLSEAVGHAALSRLTPKNALIRRQGQHRL
jgi:hypothetical protein